MPLVEKSTVVVLERNCPVEEAEPLLQWLQDHPEGKVDLGACEHLHTALLQVLIAMGPTISSAPRDQDLRAWVKTALASNDDETQEPAP